MKQFGLHRKVKGSSLFYAIVISLLIGLFAGFLILFFYYKRIASDDLLIRDQLIRNVSSGITLLMNSEKLNYNEEYTNDLFSEKSDTVILKKQKWGFFDLLFCEARKGNRSEKTLVMIGMEKKKDKNTVLYITDFDRALTVTGKTKITGTAFLPTSGIEKGYVNGNSFIGDEPVHGTIKQSEKQFPELDDRSIKPVLEMVSNEKLPDENFTEATLDADSIQALFNATGIRIDVPEAITLKSQFIRGKVFIRSKKRITVEEDAKLEDIVLVAPVIEFKKNFKGKLQAFASDSILTGEECEFYYPSVLAVVQTKLSAVNGAVLLGEKNKMNGELIGLKLDEDMQKHVFVSMGEGDNLCGNIICNDIVNLRGKIYGSVIANKLILKTSSAVYENYLSDTEIDVTKMPGGFGGCPILKKEYHKTIIRCVN